MKIGLKYFYLQSILKPYISLREIIQINLKKKLTKKEITNFF